MWGGSSSGEEGVEGFHGKYLPSVMLMGTGGYVDLTHIDRLVLFIFPRLSHATTPQPNGWESIPGMKGCTCQSQRYSNKFDDFIKRGVKIYGLSMSSVDYNKDPKKRLELPFDILSDPDQELIGFLNLPIQAVHGVEVAQRITLYVEYGKIIKAFFPVTNPAKDADVLLDYLNSLD